MAHPADSDGRGIRRTGSGSHEPCCSGGYRRTGSAAGEAQTRRTTKKAARMRCGHVKVGQGLAPVAATLVIELVPFTVAGHPSHVSLTANAANRWRKSASKARCSGSDTRTQRAAACLMTSAMSPSSLPRLMRRQSVTIARLQSFGIVTFASSLSGDSAIDAITPILELYFK